jgi:hypothetical protein
VRIPQQPDAAETTLMAQQLLLERIDAIAENTLCRNAGQIPHDDDGKPTGPHRNGEVLNRSVRDECLGKLILFGESSLRRALTQFTEHYECAS